MPDDQVSYRLQAEAVQAVARAECLKAIRCRDSEADLMMKHLAAAVATLRLLARKAVGVERGRQSP